MKRNYFETCFKEEIVKENSFILSIELDKSLFVSN
jgi:hypothetical protein